MSNALRDAGAALIAAAQDIERLQEEISVEKAKNENCIQLFSDIKKLIDNYLISSGR